MASSLFIASLYLKIASLHTFNIFFRTVHGVRPLCCYIFKSRLLIPEKEYGPVEHILVLKKV